MMKTPGDPSGKASEIIWGINPVLEVLKTRAGQINEIIFQPGLAGVKCQQIIDAAGEHGITVRFGELPLGKYEKNIRHQGVVARLTPYSYLDFDALLSRLSGLDEPPFLVALDSIQDPQNLGAISRSALAAGALAILVPKDRTASVGGAAFKASAGALAHIDICRVTNLVTTLQQLKEQGVWVFGTTADESGTTIYDADFSLPLCMVIGSEEKGLRPLVQKQCDFLVTIPMTGGLDSLNASAAAAVVFFEIVRQRRQQQ